MADNVGILGHIPLSESAIAPRTTNKQPLDPQEFEVPQLFGAVPAAQPNSTGFGYTEPSHRQHYKDNSEDAEDYHESETSPTGASFQFATTTAYSIILTNFVTSAVITAVSHLYGYVYRAMIRTKGGKKDDLEDTGESPSTNSASGHNYGSELLTIPNVRSRRPSQSSTTRIPDERVDISADKAESANHAVRDHQSVIVRVPGHPDRNENGVWTCSCPGHFV